MGKRIYDISLPLSEQMPVWPTSEQYHLSWKKTMEKDGINESCFSLNTHTGTHLDVPYHFSNSGIISWFDFAVAIRELSGLNCQLHPISSAQYPTPAKRPAYSAMDTSGGIPASPGNCPARDLPQVGAARNLSMPGKAPGSLPRRTCP